MPEPGDAKGDYRGATVRDDITLNAWLAKRPTEAPLEPDLPIVDPHHHLGLIASRTLPVARIAGRYRRRAQHRIDCLP
jgi:hypothetical protein